MIGVGLVELAVLLALVVGAAVVLSLVLRTGGRRVPPTRESRWVAATRLAGLVVGLVAAGQVWQRGSYGTGPMLAPAVLGLCVLVAVALGETVVRPRRGRGRARRRCGPGGCATTHRARWPGPWRPRSWSRPWCWPSPP